MKIVQGNSLLDGGNYYNRTPDCIYLNIETPIVCSDDPEILDAYWESLCEGAVEYVRKWVGTVYVDTMLVFEYHYDYKPTDTEVMTDYRKLEFTFRNVTIAIENKVVLIEH